MIINAKKLMMVSDLRKNRTLVRFREIINPES